MNRTIRSEFDRDSIIELIKHRALPFTVSVLKGKKRSLAQNALQRKWLTEAAEQLGEYTAEEYRGYCKLTMGVPILRAENDEFCEKYDRILRPLTYEQKIEIMCVPLDFPVTRLMDTKQKTTYLDAMYTHFTGLGCQLTEPS
ncbi:MAG: hypothetical protein GY861_02660 [bacterium]|nr:hypothetical protein [bacterium]